MLRQTAAWCLASVLTLSLVLPAQAHENTYENTIVVQGNGAVTAQPDSFSLSAGVESHAKTVAEARTQNATQMARVTSAIKGLGIPGLTLQTSSFYVYPMNSDPKHPERVTGYKVNNQLSIKCEGADPDKIANHVTRIIDAATTQGATNTSGPNFYLSRNNKAPQDALRLAVLQAKSNAQVIADALGVKLSGVYTVDSYAQNIPMRAEAAPMMAKAMAYDGAAPETPVEAGQFDVTSNVSIRFDITE